MRLGRTWKVRPEVGGTDEVRSEMGRQRGEIRVWEDIDLRSELKRPEQGGERSCSQRWGGQRWGGLRGLRSGGQWWGGQRR